MESFKKNNKGFTLVELLIAMSIFVVFLGILMNSYTSIIRSQREANDYRVMYSEARHVFETITQELRNGMVDYNHYCADSYPLSGAQESIRIIDKDGVGYRTITLDEPVYEEVVRKIKYEVFDKHGLSIETGFLNSDAVSVENLEFNIYPYVDPYNDKYVLDSGYQFHPMVTVSATFERERTNKEPYVLTLQTTISSRIYNQVYKDDNCS